MIKLKYNSNDAIVCDLKMVYYDIIFILKRVMSIFIFINFTYS